ncbi:hypothetical protein [Amnibacterium setariae]|uniref:hypothetical protein n=1 Tax=Amnibacterium setariae TaxID=2306585 RepID=UPI001314F3B1|nr:hypothetical protein [Amnibacterium setariae]
MADSFPSVQVEDAPSIFRALGHVLGQLLEVVNVLRDVPEWGPYLDGFIASLARQNS